MWSSVSSVFPSGLAKGRLKICFQTASIIAEVMYGQIYRRINGKTPIDTGIALIFFRKFRCPAGAMISLVRASGLAACLRQTAVQPSTKFSGLLKKGRLKTIHPVFRRPFCRFTLLPIQIRTGRESRRLRPRRFSRRRGLWAGRAFSSCCRTGRR